MKADKQKNRREREGWRRMCLAAGWVLFGVFSQSNLFAGASASHTITIRVIRPNVMTTQTISSTFSENTQQADHTLKLQWNTDVHPKKITTSVSGAESKPDVQLQRLQENGSASDPRLYLDRTEKECIPPIAENRGSVLLKCSVKPKPASVGGDDMIKVLYTISDI